MNDSEWTTIEGLAVRSAAGPGEPIFWIHGYTLDSSLWAELWRLLPEHGHYGVDLPGHGLSPPIHASDTREAVAARLRRIADAVGARHLVALSFGTVIALEMAIQDPERFATLVLAAPTFARGPVEDSAQTRNLALERLHAQRGAGPWMTELWMTAPPDIFTAARRDPALFERLREVIGRHGWSELAAGGMDGFMAQPQPARAIAPIAADCLLLIGEQEMAAFRRSAHLLGKMLPRARVREMPGAGHLCLLEDPAAAAALIRGHVAAYSSPPPPPCHATPGVT